MKKILKKIGLAVGALVALAGLGVIYLFSAYPRVGDMPELNLAATPEKLAHGKYLAHHVTVCIDCHSTRDFNFYSGPVIQGTEGKGGAEFIESFGVLRAPNITPAALGQWRDAELARAITCGVTNSGEALFPMMPYTLYNNLAQEDVEAIVAYVRTLAPIANEVPRSQIGFPLNLIMRTIPQPYTPKTRPPVSDTLAYGKYLTTIAGCHFCHTKADERGQPLPGMDFAGGMEFSDPALGTARSANITPEADTGIGAWERAYFINRFKEYADSTKSHIRVEKGEANTVMAWTMYAGMKEEDLNAIYSYLRTVKSVRNAVEKFSPAQNEPKPVSEEK